MQCTLTADILLTSGHVTGHWLWQLSNLSIKPLVKLRAMVTEDTCRHTFCHFHGSWMVPSCRKGQNKAKKYHYGQTKVFKAKVAQKRPKSAKMPNRNFQGQTPSKKAKFDLFGSTQGQLVTLQWRMPVPWDQDNSSQCAKIIVGLMAKFFIKCSQFNFFDVFMLLTFFTRATLC